MSEYDERDWIEEAFPYDGPHSQRSVELASAAIPRLVRYLNNATQGRNAAASLRYAVAVDTILSNLTAAAYGMNQLTRQLGDAIEHQADNPTLYDHRDEHEASDTAASLASQLRTVPELTEALGASLDQARQSSSCLGNRESAEDLP